MKNKISALGQYIVKKTGKPFNFKLIKADPIYKGVLFSIGTDDYLVTNDRVELLSTIELLSLRTSRDYPPKLIKRYTHAKFEKVKDKKEETVVLNGIRYTVIHL
ncbi:hypothetical protein H3N56_01505 [Cetobacterium sp. 2A]|uniref:hypothetical protein n=1 Tax=unclassified Cetobacterium TaxID=2630983 RepID=UPI00163B9C5B|nr:hypothetical protein [Cetobacterium sp. 2A]MBC2855171.1 hypothetical protein [Cetobacterium sp. 2A]